MVKLHILGGSIGKKLPQDLETRGGAYSGQLLWGKSREGRFHRRIRICEMIEGHSEGYVRVGLCVHPKRESVKSVIDGSRI